MKNSVVGIDVSKEKLDLCLLIEGKIKREMVVVNTSKAIKASLTELARELELDLTELLICAEYTGQYTYPLSCACEELGIDLWLENPAQIKHSSGVQRGKNDRLDARKIAAYAMRFQDKARLFSLPEQTIASLRQLISERDMLVSDKAKYQGQLTDQQDFISKADYDSKQKTQASN